MNGNQIVRLQINCLPTPFARRFGGGFIFLRLPGGFAGLAVEFGLDVVLDPFLIPPFHRQDRDAVQIDAKMQVITGG